MILFLPLELSQDSDTYFIYLFIFNGEYQEILTN